MSTLYGRPCAALAAIAAGGAAFGGPTEVWSFDETTTGNDVLYTSPTAVPPNAGWYEATSSINLLEVRVEFIGLEFGPFDVTDQIPPESQMNTAQAIGPAPLVLFDDMFVFPAPPEPVSFAGDLRVELLASGFGQLTLTNVVLGTVEVDLGFPFGVQTVQLTSVRMAGTLEVSAFPLGDLDGDGTVGGSDLALLLGAWGPCPVDDICLADLDRDGVVGGADLALLLGNWGGTL